MIIDILLDFLSGLYESIRVDTLIYLLMVDDKIKNITWKICKYNVAIPIFAQFIIDYIVPNNMAYIIIYFVKIFNIIFYFLNCIEFIGAMNSVYFANKKSKKNVSIIDTSAIIITICIFQLSMIALIGIIHYLLYDNAYYIFVIINYLILAIYHSFDCYNNVWQNKNINIVTRINMYEKMWAYYFGYGTLSVFLYTYSHNMYILGIYNLYFIVLRSIPFQDKNQRQPRNYPKINMRIFTYLCEWIIYPIIGLLQNNVVENSNRIIYFYH